jgi:proteasome lid subunit RPN8/RPN11
LLFGDGDVVDRLVRGRNVHPTPETRYEIDPAQLRQALLSSDDSDRYLVGIYHSHPATEPRPSYTDVTNARWPAQVYVLTSLRSEPPDVFAYRITDGEATKIPIVET